MCTVYNKPYFNKNLDNTLMKRKEASKFVFNLSVLVSSKIMDSDQNTSQIAFLV